MIKTQHLYLFLVVVSVTTMFYLSRTSAKSVDKCVEPMIDTPKEINAQMVNDKIKVHQQLVYRKTYDFSYIIRPNSKRWRKLQDGTYQNSKYDVGNINYQKQFVGTNRSISLSL